MKMPNTKLVAYLREARKRGFSDLDVRNSLLKHGWPLDEIEAAFLALSPKYKFKNQVTIFMDNEVLKILEKRAKKNMFTVSEQIEDILRRSCLGMKQKPSYDKNLDDALVGIFSREKRGRRARSIK